AVPTDDVKSCLSVLAAAQKAMPKLPVEKPPGEGWAVRVFEVRGPFALSLRRRTTKNLIYPNEVIERSFGVKATTREWSTVLAIEKILSGRASEPNKRA